ncbi:MAG: nitroreductase family protein [Sporomusaceae bacterium]|nr:nitroreductase family protein [Sporomusaceae bacterium]
MAKEFLTAVKDRRSFYGISKEAVLSDEKIQEIIRHAIQFAPSAFNSQSARVLLLLGKEHDRLWELTKDVLRKIVPSENFAATEQKIDSFKNGYGTVLYFEDQTVVAELQNKFAAYKDNFPRWSEQSSGMLQFIIWTALEEEGLGASLQHYSPLIDEGVQKNWQVPDTWKLIAQMPFGKPIAVPDPKESQPLETRFKVFK